MANRLAEENSPYLLQHADNPVKWYPWGQEALAKARVEDKPIFLSIGYAACHWCHVMAHESFEDPQTAAIMNEHFINIKVDREERPDLDSIYMNAVVAMTGQGGWPMSVFLTPDGEPFFGGTYYPPARRFNMPSFREVLHAVRQTWQNDRQGVQNSASRISDYLQRANQIPSNVQTLKPETLDDAALALAQAYDWKYGGWGSAPKFPQPMTIEFLLRRAISSDQLARDIAVHALDSMSRGGMYDVIGGGFARYSTDNEWLVPHFEKMLYDNAQLTRAYLHAYLVTGREDFRRVCEQTLDFILREMSHPEGGFYSSLDADSEGEEGKYYVWTHEELRQALQEKQDYQLFASAYHIPDVGNFEGKIVLQRSRTDDELAKQYSVSVAEIVSRLEQIHQQLLTIRQQRIRPATDDKVLTAWNALGLLAFAEAARYLDRADYLSAAQRNGSFLLDELFSGERLLRSWRAGKAQHNAFLEDHASLILGLLSLYQSDPYSRWYSAAESLCTEMVEHFHDPQGGFYDTRDDHDQLITRPKDLQDNATPCGNSLAAAALLQMTAYNGNLEWLEMAERMLASIQPNAARYPTAFANWLCAINAGIAGIREIALIGEPHSPQMQDFISVLWERFRPDLVVAQSSMPIPDDSPPLLAGRSLLDNLPTAFICQKFVCQMPVNSPQEFRAQLDEASSI